MPGKIKLKVTAGCQVGKEFVFEEHDTFIFGRMDDCHAALPDDTYVSRHHFILETNPPDARLRDLGSLNGTYINNKKYGGRDKNEAPEIAAQRHYPEVDLHDGDEIRVGDTVLKVIVILVEFPVFQPIVCQKCGKDVSAEVGSGRQGEYICQSCRQQARNDPGQLLINLLNQGAVVAPELNIPDYIIERKLGEGGMGAVYLVRHKRTSKMAALKVMIPEVAVDEQARMRFQREMELTRHLSHPNIVSFLDSGSVSGVFYFLLEYCDGGSLFDLMMSQHGRMNLREAGPIILQALDGLAYAHSSNTIHRDLKPQNILLSGQNQLRVAKIADMGLAKNYDRAGWGGNTITGSYGGSFPFMPREQITNFKDFKPSGDVWAMGATFYNVLTGKYPREFRRGQDPVDVILKGLIVPIRQRDPGIPASVAEVIDRALVDDPAGRYQNAGEMRKALGRVL
jgi:hypothetical protein